ELTEKLFDPSVRTTLFGRKRVLPKTFKPLEAPSPVSLLNAVNAPAAPVVERLERDPRPSSCPAARVTIPPLALLAPPATTLLTLRSPKASKNTLPALLRSSPINPLP